MRIVLDLEANGLEDASQVWCICTTDVDTGEERQFYGDTLQHAKEYILSATEVIGHNIIEYDHRVLGTILDIQIPTRRVTDTLTLSRLLKHDIEGGHSLEAWGLRLGIAKVGTDITDWSVYHSDMLARCITDCQINAATYKYLWHKLNRTEFTKAIEVEHELGWICRDMRTNGFRYNLLEAEQLFSEIDIKVKELDDLIAKELKPKAKAIKTITPRVTQHGTFHKSDFRWYDSNDLTVFNGGQFTVFEYEPFNANSPKQVVERLNEARWKPTDKTKGHIDAERSRDRSKIAEYKRTGFKINETNLATLPEDAPRALQSLVERILLASRLRTLETWKTAYNPLTGRVHARFIPIGTWTHRMAHRDPNLGNVSAEKSIKYKGAYLNALATNLGGRMRSFWHCDDGSWLVGTDAQGIQLRIFAHYINDDGFTERLLNGDPHSYHAELLGISRNSAKTFIYAFLLGAGDGKLGDIIGGTTADGKRVKQQFVEGYPGLKALKQSVIPRDASRGYFQGFDGRLVVCDSEHLMMAGYLQNGEACIMKHANVMWRKQLDEEHYQYKQVNFVHDEYQTEVRGTKETAEAVGRIQADCIRRVGEDFGLRCPMAGSSNVGHNWLDTH